MTELARTPPAFRHLFQTVDLAPLPCHRAISQSLDAWRERRGGEPAPTVRDMTRDETREVRDHSFVLERRSGDADLRLARIGTEARKALGREQRGDRLAEMANPRMAVRLRRLFALVLERGEPVDVRFTDRGAAFELLAAPVRNDGRVTGAFCAVAIDRPARPAPG